MVERCWRYLGSSPFCMRPARRDALRSTCSRPRHARTARAPWSVCRPRNACLEARACPRWSCRARDGWRCSRVVRARARCGSFRCPTCRQAARSCPGRRSAGSRSMTRSLSSLGWKPKLKDSKVLRTGSLDSWTRRSARLSSRRRDEAPQPREPTLVAAWFGDGLVERASQLAEAEHGETVDGATRSAPVIRRVSSSMTGSAAPSAEWTEQGERMAVAVAH